MQLRVARYKRVCTVLGPGRRAVVWFHGCALDCPGCIANDMNRSKKYLRFTPGELGDLLLSIDGIEGVTLTGGDPFDQQRDALLELLTLLRRDSELSIMCYTGRTLDELRVGPGTRTNEQILKRIDILIDGPYMEELNVGNKWRGSSNQQMHFLTHRYRGQAKKIQSAMDRSVEIDVSADGVFTMAGIPRPGFLRGLGRSLDARGVVLKFDEI